jgi:para-nitrobenzyl esterase
MAINIHRRRFNSGVLSAGLLSCHATLASRASNSTAAPIASTQAGRVEGALIDHVYVFKGIPYGADTHERRFMSAIPAMPWDELRPALSYGAASPQSRADEPISEDCLYLNVWTPNLRDGAARPVMFYIHGGEFSAGSGSSPLYDGTQLCQHGDVVVITLNHRLSAFGHLYLAKLGAGEYPDSGNVALLDIVLALQWVRTHAREFGGDPNQVMLFGQSGGGAKIATLMAMPAARGLFHRVATMSGQQLTAASPHAATHRADVFLQALQIKPDQLSALRDVPLDKLLKAVGTADPSLEGRSIYFGPVLDARNLPRHPFYPDAPPQSAHIPMIIGNTREETRFFYANDASVQDLSWANLPDKLERAIYVDIDVQQVIAEYRRWYPQYSATDVFFAASTAARSWRGAIVEAELRAQQGAPVYAYQLDYRSPLDNGKWGACHTLDIPLVFGTLNQPGSLAPDDAMAQAVSAQLRDAFIAFAHAGNPNHRGLPKWQPYRLPTRETLVINATSSLQLDPRQSERELFATVPYIQRGTF